MLTLVEAISLAGDRAKQNDDACGFTGPRAWVIDGATDLHDSPLTHDASDASWLARFVNRLLYRRAGNDFAATLREISQDAASAFASSVGDRPYERWQSPIASLLMIVERGDGLRGVDLGDCCVFTLGADGAAQTAGGVPGAAEAESRSAARQTDAHKPLLQRTETLERLRRQRESINREGAPWTFGLDSTCANHARLWAIEAARPAHLLLMTDGFSALTDRYDAYDAGGLVQAALDKGLQELGREVRAIENDDAGGKFPRFKKSDDATAVLLRWS